MYNAIDGTAVQKFIYLHIIDQAFFCIFIISRILLVISADLFFKLRVFLM